MLEMATQLSIGIQVCIAMVLFFIGLIDSNNYSKEIIDKRKRIKEE